MTESQNPYTPPDARVKDEPGPGSPIKAVLVGLAVDIGGSIAAGIVLTLVYGVLLASTGATPEEIAAAATAIAPGSWIFITGMAMGCGFSVWGGYLCARIAGRRAYASGVVVAAISTAFGAAFGSEGYSAGLNLALLIATFGAVMFGVRMGVTKNRAMDLPQA
ncbi:MAG TPA: hypothetical protein VF460_03470 [Burkholderiales bacterium]